MSVYVTDTHPLIYYAGRNNVQLSDRAREAFEQAERGEAFILIPAPALWEVSMLEQAGHIKLRKPFREWTRDLLRNPCFECTPLDAEIIIEARDYHFNVEAGREARMEAVLNAFRHHRKTRRLEIALRTAVDQCSTPFGITEKLAKRQRKTKRSEECAQRLSASQKNSHFLKDMFQLSFQCSTPFGITEKFASDS